MAVSNQRTRQAVVVSAPKTDQSQAMERLALYDEGGQPLDLSGAGGGGVVVTHQGDPTPDPESYPDNTLWIEV